MRMSHLGTNAAGDVYEDGLWLGCLGRHAVIGPDGGQYPSRRSTASGAAVRDGLCSGRGRHAPASRVARERRCTVLCRQSDVLMSLAQVELADALPWVRDAGPAVRIGEHLPPRHFLVPSGDDVFERGLEALWRELGVAPDVPWENRSDELFWRGGCSGEGLRRARGRSVSGHAGLRRAPDDEMVRGRPSFCQCPDQLFAPERRPREHCHRRLLLAVDGNSVASSASWMLGCGSALVLVGEWAPNRLPCAEEGKHYVHVGPDLVGLIPAIDDARQRGKVWRAARVLADRLYQPAFLDAFLERSLDAALAAR